MSDTTSTPELSDAVSSRMELFFSRAKDLGLAAHAFTTLTHAQRQLPPLQYIEALEEKYFELFNAREAEIKALQDHADALAANIKSGNYKLYITLCEAGDCYGGAEEGGWYYTAYEPIASVAIHRKSNKKRIEAAKRKLLAAHLPDLPMGYDRPYSGPGCGGCGDDESFGVGEMVGNEGYAFIITKGEPYEWKGRPRYE